MNFFTVFSKRVANKLCNQGFRVVNIGINNQKPWLNVYFFEDTPEFQLALKSITGK